MTWRAALLVGLVAALSACAHAPPMPTIAHLDLDRFAGDWFVLAHLPLRAERHAYDAVEHYDVVGDGRIAVRFTFRDGGFDGRQRVLRMRGWVHDRSTMAEWRVRPFWPIAFEYRVIYLDPEYRFTVIGHSSRDYAWIMARTPEVDEAAMAVARSVLEANGYDLRRLRTVPQSAR